LFEVKVIFYNLNSIFGATLEINYPGDKIEITDIISGNYFPSDTSVLILKKIENNRISYGISSKMNIGKTLSGSGVICKLKCKAKQSGSISFTINTQKLDIRKLDGSLYPNISDLQIDNLNLSVQ